MLINIQICHAIKLNRLLVVFVGLACLALARLAVAETCEGDKLALPDATALPTVQASAMAGDTHAQAQLGAVYLRGKGVEMDTAKALSWLEKSAAGGNSEGQYLLAEYYGVNGKSESDFHKAAVLFQQSADHGCLGALFYLGGLTLKGKGVPKNTEVGIGMIRKAAEAGYTQAQWWLGSMLITGDEMNKDTKSGFNWTKQAADSGDSVAQILLANLYLGGIGTPPNPEAARTLLESVYVKHDEQAPTVAYHLGWMYMEGKGVPVDTMKAFNWMIIAAKSNISDSAQRLTTLTEQLPKQKLATACSVYLDPSFATNGAKEYAHVNAGETIAVLSLRADLAVVYFPDRRLEGFILKQCLSSD